MCRGFDDSIIITVLVFELCRVTSESVSGLAELHLKYFSRILSGARSFKILMTVRVLLLSTNDRKVEATYSSLPGDVFFSRTSIYVAHWCLRNIADIRWTGNTDAARLF